MRVLFLTQVLPYPLNGGAKIRAYYMLKQLAQEHEVTLVSFVRDDDSAEYITHLTALLHAVHTIPITRSKLQDGVAIMESLVRNRPIVILRDRVKAMQETLRQLVADTDFDIVHADQTNMAQYALFAHSAAPSTHKPKLLLDQHNALYLMVERQSRSERGWLKKVVWRREATLLRRYEKELCQQFDHVLTVTENDKRVLMQLVGTNDSDKFTAIPICIDPEETEPFDAPLDGNHILHLGTMFWPPNIEGVLWFSEHVLPLILEQVPDVCFTIAGKNPPESIVRLGQVGSELTGHVAVTGYVEDPAPLLARCKVFIVPLLAGGGMRVKIVDGWRWGLPIVSTTIGAEGIELVDKENILIADTPKQFADAVVTVLKDTELANQLRQNGRTWVEQKYGWRIQYERISRLYRQLAT